MRQNTEYRQVTGVLPLAPGGPALAREVHAPATGRSHERFGFERSMKVLAITNLFPNAREPNRGVFNLQQLAALQRYSEIRVISPIAWQPWVYGMRRPVPEEARWSDIPAAYPLYFFTPRIGRAAYAMWMYGSIRSTVMRINRQYQPDVILGTWAYPDVVAVAAL